MEKFLNLMYDFFAFALPGACIIASILLLCTDNKSLYSQLPEQFTNNLWHLFLALALLGYIVGYIIKPIARYILLRKLSIWLYGRFLPLCEKRKKKDSEGEGEVIECEELAMELKKINWSDEFTRIRELTPKSFQYIEFWDMHMATAHNLAFACIVFIVIQIINLCSCNATLNVLPMIILFVTIILSFLILLRVSLKFSIWWSNDIKAAKQFINDKKKK